VQPDSPLVSRDIHLTKPRSRLRPARLPCCGSVSAARRAGHSGVSGSQGNRRTRVG
jgi:hypothetical protein